MIPVLLEREFPIGELRLLASGRSAGMTVAVAGRPLSVIEATPEAFEGVDIALFSAGADISRELAPQAVARGCTVIDNSNAWRMDPGIPLVVSQVNPTDLAGSRGHHRQPELLDDAARAAADGAAGRVGLERVVVDTYQAVSGTGADAVAELEAQIGAHAAGDPKEARVYPHPIAFNALPEIDVFLDNGYTKEEWKVVTESRKILHLPDLRVSCTAVRVPVFVGPLGGRPRRDQRADHAAGRPCAVRGRARRGRAGRSGRRTSTRWRPRPPAGTRSSSAASGRTRRSRTGAASPSGCVSDNLRKGAATNAVEIAELLVARGWVAPASRRARPAEAETLA